jgi:uncharacterized protein YlxW (UPF0749 family)
LRGQIKGVSDEIKAANGRLSQTSTQAQRTQQAYSGQRDVAGLTAAKGPGIVVDLANGKDPHNPNDTRQSWQVRYLDIQDVVNVLWAAGAEAVSVNR